MTDSYDYAAFGEELTHTGTTVNDFRYVGEQWNANVGWYYNRARWMDPSTGRFTSADPYDGCVECAMSQHKYLYANVSPISKRDPTGKFTLLEVLQTIETATNNAAIAIRAFVVGKTCGVESFSMTVSYNGDNNVIMDVNARFKNSGNYDPKRCEYAQEALGKIEHPIGTPFTKDLFQHALSSSEYFEDGSPNGYPYGHRQYYQDIQIDGAWSTYNDVDGTYSSRDILGPMSELGWGSDYLFVVSLRGRIIDNQGKPRSGQKMWKTAENGEPKTVYIALPRSQ